VYRRVKAKDWSFFYCVRYTPHPERVRLWVPMRYAHWDDAKMRRE